MARTLKTTCLMAEIPDSDTKKAGLFIKRIPTSKQTENLTFGSYKYLEKRISRC